MLAGLIRLVHPFPSLLDGAATVAIAMVAGAEPWAAIRLGGAMVALQASIGALNDVLDATTDTDRKPGKPIPAGLVPVTVGRAVVVLGAAVGLLLATPFGPGVVAVAGLGLAIGYAYDVGAKGTAWSWLPFALGAPLLPVFAWFGATGGLPGVFIVLVPAGFVAGAALAIANARADLERDRDASLVSVAARLGPDQAWSVHAVLLGGVVVVALGSSWLAGVTAGSLGLAFAASAIVVIGIAWSRGGDAPASRRERAWEIEAVGVALLGAAWLIGIGGPNGG